MTTRSRQPRKKEARHLLPSSKTRSQRSINDVLVVGGGGDLFSPKRPQPIPEVSLSSEPTAIRELKTLWRWMELNADEQHHPWLRRPPVELPGWIDEVNKLAELACESLPKWSARNKIRIAQLHREVEDLKKKARAHRTTPIPSGVTPYPEFERREALWKEDGRAKVWTVRLEWQVSRAKALAELIKLDPRYLGQQFALSTILKLKLRAIQGTYSSSRRTVRAYHAFLAFAATECLKPIGQAVVFTTGKRAPLRIDPGRLLKLLKRAMTDARRLRRRIQGGSAAAKKIREWAARSHIDLGKSAIVDLAEQLVGMWIGKSPDTVHRLVHRAKQLKRRPT